MPSCRIRVMQMVPHLEAHGLCCTLVRYPGDRAAKASLREAFGDHDVVLLQKKLPSWGDARWWRRCPLPVVFDYDDALPFRDRPKGGSYTSSMRRARFDRVVRLSSGLVAGNRYLAGLAASERPTLIAPSPVPHEVPQHTSHAAVQEPGDHQDGSESAASGPGGAPRIGWVGSAPNLGALATLQPVLQRLAERREFVLHVVADAAPQLDGVPIEYTPWSLEAQDALVAGFDVGVMPLPEVSPWSKGKCSYKILQYMAASVPAVATRVGMNEDVIQHERNGLLCGDDEQWLAALEGLIDDAARADRLGAAGRQTVLDAYTYPAVAQRMQAFLHEIVDAAR